MELKNSFKIQSKDPNHLYSKYSDPSYHSGVQSNWKNKSEVSQLKNEISNLRNYISNYISKDNSNNQIVSYKSNVNDSQRLYTPKKSKNIEHPNLNPFLKKNKKKPKVNQKPQMKKSLKVYDTEEKSNNSEKEIYKLDCFNKWMKLILREKKKLETMKKHLDLLKKKYTKKHSNFQSFRKELKGYFKQKSSTVKTRFYSKINQTFKNQKKSLKGLKKELFKNLSIFNIKRILLKKFERGVIDSSNLGTYDINDEKQFNQLLNEYKDLDKIDHQDLEESMQSIEDEFLNNSFTIPSVDSKDSIQSDEKAELDISFIRKKFQSAMKLKTKPKISQEKPQMHYNVTGVKTLINEMREKYKNIGTNQREYFQEYGNVSERSATKHNNSYVSKISQPTFINQNYNPHRRSQSRDTALNRRFQHNNYFSKKTTFFKDLRSEVDELLQNINKNRSLTYE